MALADGLGTWQRGADSHPAAAPAPEFTSAIPRGTRAESLPPPDISGPVELRFYLDICETPPKDTTIFLRNSGPAGILVISASILNDSAFSILGPAFPASIPPDSSLAIRVRFHPRTAGDKLGSITFNSTAANAPRLTIPLFGRKESAELLAASVYFGTLTPSQFPRIRTMAIQNNGTVAVRVDSALFGSSPPFTIVNGVPAVIPPGGSGQVTIRFNDPVLDGYYSDTLTIFQTPSCGPLKVLIAGSRMSSAILSGPTSLDLGTVHCTDADRDMVIRITNTGAFDLTISSVSVAGHPDVSVPTMLPRIIQPGNSDTIGIRIRARAPGFKAAAITFSNNSSNQPSYLVTVSMLVEGISIVAGPVDFGTARQGDFPLQRTVIIQNLNPVAVEIDSVSFARATPFAVTTTFPKSILANGSLSVGIRFIDPGVNGPYLDTLTLHASPECATFPVEVRGSRFGSPVLSTVSQMEFGGRICASPDVDTTIVLRNTGGGDLHIASIALTGNAAFTVVRQPSLPLTLRPGETDSLVIRYRTVAVGDHDATITITSDSEPVPVTVIPLHGKWDEVRLDAGDLAFGVLQAQQLPASRTITIRNTGTLAVSVTNTRFTKTGPFSVSSGLPIPIPPGGDSVLSVIFSDPLVDGFQVDTLTVLFTPGCAALKLVVSGTRETRPGIDAVTSCAFERLDCPGVFRDTLIDIRNTGARALRLQSAVISGDPDFSLIPPFTPFNIAPGLSAPLRVRFNPVTIGSKRADLIITSDAANLPVLTIRLSGGKDSIAVIAAPVRFDTVSVSAFPVSRDVEITNAGTVPVTLTGIRFIPAAPFRCTAGIPATIGPGEKTVITVRFDDPGSDSGRLAVCELEAAPSCGAIRFDVTGARATATAEIEIGSVHAAPGEIVEIPVYLRNARSLQVAGITGFRGSLRFNKTLLAPRFPAQVSEQGPDRIVSVSFPLAASSGQTLARLSFIAGLGNDLTTPLSLEGAVSVGGTARIRAIPGQFTLDNVCREGGVRLVTTDGTFSLAQNSPNPFNPVTDIEYEIIEPGPVKLLILDRLGRIVSIPVDATLLPGRYRIRFDASGLPSGMYSYALQSGDQHLVRTMMVMK